MPRLLALLISCCAVARAQDADLDKIRAALQLSYTITVNLTGADADADSYLPLVVAPGIFSDLNYTAGQATGWGGYTHCVRMAELGSLLATNASRHHNSPAVRSALLGAQGVFTWFLAAQPQDPQNWWYQMCGCGRPVAQLATQYSASFTPAQAANATALMDRAQWVAWARTGTNAADIALVHIGNGLLNGNRSYVQEAFDVIWRTTVFSDSPPPTSPEGPKPDGSFMQHGPQLYSGNYGASWTRDALSNIGLATGTAFAAPPGAYGVVTTVILDGCARMIHWPSAQWDVAVIGRQVTNPGGQAVVGQGGDAGLLDPAVLRRAGGARGAELAALAAALEDPASAPPMPRAFSAFPATDYAVQTRSGYYASVRMISARTAGGECINDQGKQSLHVADGVTYWMRSGHEYDSIAPTWDWELLPGATVQRGGAPLTCATANGMGSGLGTGVLRLRDNATGVAFMDLNATRYGQQLRAKKSYFFMEGVLLMLGAGVASAPGATVTTTLDSRLLSGRVLLSSDAGATFAPVGSGNFSYALPPAPAPPAGAPLLLVAHGGSGFAVLPSAAAAPPRAAHLLAAPVTGAWAAVGTYSGSANQTNDMFTLWLDHGAAPGSGSAGGGSYAYAVWPDTPEADFTGGAFRKDLARYAVWANSELVQAVWDSAAAELAAALHGGPASALALPAALGPATRLVPPFVCAVSVTAQSNGSTPVLSIAFAAPSLLVSATHETAYDFVIEGAALVPCTWPSCPGAVAMHKGYNGTAFPKWECMANGTLRVHSMASQLSMGVGLAPVVGCAMVAA